MVRIDTQIRQARSELEKLRKLGEKDRLRQQVEKQELEENLNKLQSVLDVFVEKGQNGSSIRAYMECMKVARKCDVIPSYALSLEAQLCRSLHHMDIFKTNLALLKKYNDGIVVSYKRQIARTSEEKGLTEIQLLNSLCTAEGERTAMKEQHIARLRQQDQAYASLRNKRHRPLVREGETKEPESSELDRIMIMIDDVVHSKHTRRKEIDLVETKETKNIQETEGKKQQEDTVVISLKSLLSFPRRNRDAQPV